MDQIKEIFPKPSSPCNCMNLRRASRALSQFYDKVLMESGLSITQMGILLTIQKLNEQATMSRLAESFRIDRTTMNRNLKPLIDTKLIQMERGKDARVRLAVLTKAGETTLHHAVSCWQKAQEMLKDYLGAEDLEKMTELLSKVEALVP